MRHLPPRVAALGGGVVASLILLNAGQWSARAQTGAASATVAPTWVRVDTVRVRPEAWGEYREIERDEVIPALRKAGVSSRSAWRTAEFGDTYEILFARPISDFGEYDAGDSFSRVLAPREAERLRERLRRCLTDRETSALVQRTDLSLGETRRPFAIVTTLTVAPGRDTEYEGFLRETLPDLKKAGIVFAVYQRVYGHTAWLLVQNIDTLQELAQPSALFRAFGEEGADRRVRGISGIVTSVERKVLRYDPELSFAVSGTATATR